MTRIDFYQIAGDERTFACRLIDQVFHRGHKIYVHTLDSEQATRLDEHLWVFRPDSFIPHCLIGSGASSGTSSDVTSNLAANIDVPIKRPASVAGVSVTRLYPIYILMPEISSSTFSADIFSNTNSMPKGRAIGIGCGLIFKLTICSSFFEMQI